MNTFILVLFDTKITVEIHSMETQMHQRVKMPKYIQYIDVYKIMPRTKKEASLRRFV